MLLRRVTKHVTDQNWFAVFIDFLIVVLGVFMGFQVQQWNESRSDKVDARQYLARLSTDMELSIARNDTQISTSRTQVKKLDLILNALDTCTLSTENEPAFLAGLYDLGKHDMPTMLMGTIDELNATGNFALIEDLDLRRLISEAVREQQTLLAVDPQIVSRTVPSVNYVRSHVRFNLDEHLNGLGATRGIDPALVMYNFSELCVDKKFTNAIATVREMRLAGIAFNKQSREDQAAIIDAIEKSLGEVTVSQEKQP